MTAFDTDVLSDLFRDAPAVVARMGLVPPDQQFVPVVVAEEILRGRLDAIRKAPSAAANWPLARAYEEFGKSLADLRRFSLLPYTTTAHALFQAWRAAKIRIGTQDLRIAAVCLAHNARLVTRNARDYTQVPGLTLELWN
jgi:tRNA(fMet)-specific endonuclease VapC